MATSAPQIGLSVRHVRSRVVEIDGMPVVDSALVGLTVFLTPFEYSLPTLGGFRVLFLLFACLGAHCILFRFDAFLRVCTSIPMLCGLAFLLLATANEFAHPFAGFEQHRRNAYGFSGTICIATLARDRRVFNVAIWSCVAVGVLLGVLLAESVATLTQDASHLTGGELRELVSDGVDDTVQHHVNELSRLGVGGLVAAVAIFHTSISNWARMASGSFAAISTVAVVATISRSGALAATLSFSVMWLLAGRRLISLCIAGLVALACLWIAYPQFYTRMVLPSTDTSVRDTRRDALIRFVETLPETAVIGIGSGHYYESWALDRGFPIIRVAMRPLGLHNCYAQAAVQWGVLAALLYAIYTIMAMKVPLRMGSLPRIQLFLTGISISSAVAIMLSHGFAAKFTVISFGFLMAGFCWVEDWETE